MSPSPTLDPLPWALGDLPVPLPPPDPDEAFRYCLARARGHEENFPVTALWPDPRRRQDLAAIYAFARQADDFADEPVFAGVREDLLDAWESQLRRAHAGERASHPVFVALAVTLRRNGLPLDPFLDLLSAFRQDARGHRYKTFDEVLDYCRRSANPVGRLVLAVNGLDDPELLKASDALCTALQLTNFWQDLSVDLPRGRVYLPDADFVELGLDREATLAGRLPRGPLIERQVARTEALYRQAAGLQCAPWPARLYLAGVRAGGWAVLRMVRRLGPRVFDLRPSLAPRRWPRMALSLLMLSSRRR